eukprot:TRINITY_DN1282_c0_g1_i2.p1 TRINITY_DN1282_c0_g1~~TRINITY_DN1282_c0_g1_i2.p1  ORF type:complete len:109 (+),score=4.57 TRINITY_DN1282_c0_g1_i2:253-579(+)
MTVERLQENGTSHKHFAVPARWWRYWKDFTGFEASTGYVQNSYGSTRPGHIDARSLIDPHTNMLRPELLSNVDYVSVSGPVWEYLKSIYTANKGMTARNIHFPTLRSH